MIDFVLKHKDIIKKLSHIGIIDPKWDRNINIYEDYIKMQNNDCQMCKYFILETKHKLDERTIRRIIYKMKNL